MAAPVHQANGSQIDNVAAISPAWPAHAINDLGLLLLQTNNEAITETDPDFVLLGTVGTGTPAAPDATALTAFWAFATSAAMPAVTTSDSGDHNSGHIETYRGAYIGRAPVLVGTRTGTGTAVTYPGGTTDVANALVLHVVAHAIDSAGPKVSGQVNAALTSVAEVFDNSSATGNGGGVSTFSGIKATAGTFGDGAATLSTASAWVSMTIIVHSLAANASAAWSNLVPTSGAPLAATADAARFTKILGRLTVSGGLPLVFGYCGTTPAVRHQIYDGAAFSPLFSAFSTITAVGGGVYDFSLLPLGGWWDAPTIRGGAFTEAP